MVQSVEDTRTENRRAQWLIAAIRDGKWKPQITKIRTVFNKNGKDRKSIDPLKKTTLQAGTWSGTFSRRASDALDSV